MTEFDEAFTIESEVAGRLVESARNDERQLDLLRLFARQQLVPFHSLHQRYGVTQTDLNLQVLGQLTKKYVKITEGKESGFYIYIEDTHQWAVGCASRDNLRRAFREVLGEDVAKLE